MRTRNLFIATAILALALPGIASAESGLKVTGGGQTFVDADDAATGGPGDTFGFNAQAVSDDDGDETYVAKGQLNHIDRDREATTARGQGDHFRGEVTCIRAVEDGNDGAAVFGGYAKGTDPGADDATLFRVYVVDNGEGQGADQEDDMIVFEEFVREQTGEYDPESPCDHDEEDIENDSPTLARGNVQFHDA